MVKTSMRVMGLICVVMLAWAFMPSATTASFTSQDMGTYILWSQASTNTYFQQYKADYSWKDSTSSSSGWNYMGKLANLTALLFDGSFHKFTDNNYSYQFWTSGMGAWQNANLNNMNQYAYDYTSGQWWDQGNWGSWAKLGNSGLSTAFMGVGGGVYETLGNNWSYLFDGTYGIWKNGNINNVNQYAYNYTTGNWYDQGNWGGWAYLGSPGLAASFIGDGSSHTLGSNWSYVFDGTYGYWKNGNMNNVNQYAYYYTTGSWYDQGNWGGWAYLGSPKLSASFVGDSGSHALGGNWSYIFDGTYGYWKNGNLNNLNQYAYNYIIGNWYDQGNLGGWAYLGPGQFSATFLGDGNWHALDSIWSYEFVNGVGYLKGSVSTWVPMPNGQSYWGSSPTQLACNYTNQDFGLYDSGVTSSVYLYDYNGGSSYNCKWTDWTYNSSGSEISAAIVFYTGTVTYDVSSWLSWLPIQPNPGTITRTETWDFASPEYALTGKDPSGNTVYDHIHAHQVRVFWENHWVVQNEQGGLGDCAVIAAIDSIEQVTGLYWDTGQILIWLHDNGLVSDYYQLLQWGSIQTLYSHIYQGNVYFNMQYGHSAGGQCRDRLRKSGGHICIPG